MAQKLAHHHSLLGAALQLQFTSSTFRVCPTPPAMASKC
ncbi:hypothetical protein VD0002_g6070 [Verticillium dahliae]|uniref:Uncharacterized protein n=1 Tax=Verticillium dahliae TaxID=27337 RepID=A0AA44WQ10_VERDA|nr:hypothetical protein BJF96_g1091 [Verticillium dahliae]PNH40263.1 hypothetical protein VD0004_g6722 [Verticillium dahliae]PNH56802.1 hypothetical protein VD0003_g891 [Verticillium dahliae]PNH61832.1 hypothetical protein VD0002_g6070 [Verticillium dahliae]PNH70794.1 hypothetical protein VD0001_g6742 [Verticillium dahliae]